MDIAHHIADLLYKNECVILPTIGGFLTHFNEAEYDFIQHRISPPSKSVAFNAKLVNNDGLLINHIAQVQHISYQQASKTVEKYCKAVEKDLFDNKIVQLEKIGKLFFNANSSLEFIPDNTNFHLDYFGLQSLDCKPVLRNKEYLKKQETQFATASSGNRQKSNPLPRVAAVLLILVLSVLLIQNFTGDKDQSIASETAHENVINEIQNANIVPQHAENNESIVEEPIEETVVEPISGSDEENEPVLINEETTKDNTSDQQEAYIIILGAFGKASSVDRLLKKMEKLDYNPYTKEIKGLTRVGIRILCKNSEIEGHLKEVREIFTEKAWLVQ